MRFVNSEQKKLISLLRNSTNVHRVFINNLLRVKPISRFVRLRLKML